MGNRSSQAKIDALRAKAQASVESLSARKPHMMEALLTTKGMVAAKKRDLAKAVVRDDEATVRAHAAALLNYQRIAAEQQTEIDAMAEDILRANRVIEECHRAATDAVLAETLGRLLVATTSGKGPTDASFGATELYNNVMSVAAANERARRAVRTATHALPSDGDEIAHLIADARNASADAWRDVLNRGEPVVDRTFTAESATTRRRARSSSKRA